MAEDKPEVEQQIKRLKQLPQDIKSLSQLRDELGDYLSTVERNTDAVNNWLATNKTKIIAAHQQLVRALRDKNEASAISVITGLGDAAGFVLSLQDFRAQAEAIFGKESKFMQSVSGIADSLPATLLEPLPDVAVPDIDLTGIAMPGIATQDKEDKSWWSSASDWFKRDQKKREEEERQLNARLRAAKADILGLQSDRHYHIDSLMDWMADTLAPEIFDENGKASENPQKMLQHMNPHFVITIAQADFREAVEDRANDVRGATLAYSRIATAIDAQDVSAIQNELKNVYPASPTAISQLMKKILLIDYQSASWDELVLKHVKNPQDQAALLSMPPAIPDEERLRFSDAKDAGSILEKFMGLVLDKKKEPLPSIVLQRILGELRKNFNASPEKLVFSTSKPKSKNIFQRVMEGFQDDVSAQRTALNNILTGLGAKNPSAVAEYVFFDLALKEKNPEVLAWSLALTRQNRSALEIVALWNLCHPDESPLENILNVSSDPATKGNLLDASLGAGLLDEIRSAQASAGNAKRSLMQQDILPALDKFPVNAARKLIAHTFSLGGLERLRTGLSEQPANWLEQVVSAAIPDQKKVEWVAALLEPFPSDIVKANILATAARNAATTKASQILTKLEKNLVGDNIALRDGTILCNIDRIANIWYDHEHQTIHGTLKGEGHTHVMLKNVALRESEEIMSIIRRRGKFTEESTGLFRPENVDEITMTRIKEKEKWRDKNELQYLRVNGPLYADRTVLSELETRADFLHANISSTSVNTHFNISSICLLQELDDGTTLLVDQFGRCRTLDTDSIRIQSNSQLQKIDSHTWLNPGNAQILRMDKESNTLLLHISGKHFRELLAKYAKADDDIKNTLHDLSEFYPIKLGKQAFSNLQKSLGKTPDTHAVALNKDVTDFFNMQQLGYLAWDENRGGFNCKQYGYNPQFGFIGYAEEHAAQVFDILTNADGILCIGSLLIHENNIDEAYVDAKNNLQFSIDNNNELTMTGSPAETKKALAKLAKNKNFHVVTTNRAGDPIDIIHFDRVTLISYNKEEKSTVITEIAIPLTLDEQDFKALLKRATDDGSSSIQKETPETWIKMIGPTLQQLPGLEICVAPVIADGTPQDLLQQVLGRRPLTEATPQALKDAFKTVATLPAPYESFHYPEAAFKEPSKGSSPSKNTKKTKLWGPP